MHCQDSRPSGSTLYTEWELPPSEWFRGPTAGWGPPPCQVFLDTCYIIAAVKLFLGGLRIFLQRSWLFILASSKNHESRAICLSEHSWFFPSSCSFFSFICCPPLGCTVQSGRWGYFRLCHCHLAWGSTCVPEVLILILNRLDTKTNRLSSLHQTGLRNYGHREAYAITAANLRSSKLAPFPVPPATLDFKYWGALCVCVGAPASVCVQQRSEKWLGE